MKFGKFDQAESSLIQDFSL